MTTFRKSRLSMALGVALGAAAMIPATSMASSVNAISGLPESDDGGDSLIYSVYAATNVDGNQTVTAFSVTNTSWERYIVAKVRFREQTHSMDALDFVIVLSPEDKFDFFVRPAANANENGGRPVVEWNDDTCVIGPPLGAKKAPFPAIQNFPGTNPPVPMVSKVSDLELGHLEVIGMFSFDTSPWASDCGEMRRIISDPDFDGSEFFDFQADNWGWGDVPDALIGRFVVRAVGRGIEVGGNAVPIKQTFTGPFYAAQSPAACNALNVNPTSDENHPCVGMYNWDTQWFDHPHFGDMLRAGPWNLWTVAEDLSPLPRKIDQVLRAYELQGDWASTDANNVLTEWVVSFPTKYVYTDFRPNLATYEWVFVNPHSRRDVISDVLLPLPARLGETGNSPFDSLNTWQGAWTYTGLNIQNLQEWAYVNGQLVPAQAPSWGLGPREYTGDNGLCLTGNQWRIWDTDENPVTVLSPFNDPFPICNEVNFYSIRSVASTKDKIPLFASTHAEEVVVEAIVDGKDVERGWAELSLAWPQIIGRPINYGWGAATVGYDVIQRATDNANQNNGTLSDLARRQRVGSPY